MCLTIASIRITHCAALRWQPVMQHVKLFLVPLLSQPLVARVDWLNGTLDKSCKRPFLELLC